MSRAEDAADVRRAVLDEIEREITDRIINASDEASNRSDPYACGVATGAHDALCGLQRWINSIARSRTTTGVSR